MIETVTRYTFQDRFKAIRPDNFTYEGLEALFLYLEENEDEEYELDVIELCCEYTEYSDLEEFWEDYDKEEYPDMESIEDETLVLSVGTDSFIIQEF